MYRRTDAVWRLLYRQEQGDKATEEPEWAIKCWRKTLDLRVAPGIIGTNERGTVHYSIYAL